MPLTPTVFKNQPHRVGYYMLFQASTGDLGPYSLQIRGEYCTQVCKMPCRAKMVYNIPDSSSIYVKDNLTGKFFLPVEVSTEAKQED